MRPTVSRAGTFRTSRIMCRSWAGFHLSQLTGRSIPVQWRIQGEGPGGRAPLIFRPNWRQKSRKFVFETAPPPTTHPLCRGLDDRGPLIWRSGPATAVIMRTSLLIKISQIPNSMHERNGVSTKTRPWNRGFFIVNDWSCNGLVGPVLTFGKRP